MTSLVYSSAPTWACRKAKDRYTYDNGGRVAVSEHIGAVGRAKRCALNPDPPLVLPRTNGGYDHLTHEQRFTTLQPGKERRMCVRCEMEDANQGIPRELEPQEPTILESGVAGMGIGFAVYLVAAVVTVVGMLVDHYNAMTFALVASLIVGFLGGAHKAMRR